MERFNAEVKVNIKPSIKDIKALTLKQAVSNLVMIEDFDCKIGNVYNLTFEAENKTKAQKIIQTVCEEILANSVIEEYEITWH